MIKQDIVNKVAARNGYEPAHVKYMLEEILGAIADALRDGDNVYLRTFGTFAVYTASPKMARIISRNESMVIPARPRVKFKASTYIRDHIKQQ